LPSPKFTAVFDVCDEEIYVSVTPPKFVRAAFAMGLRFVAGAWQLER